MSALQGRENIHATAVVVATTGLLFLGPSGSGKSARAFACLDAAARNGLFGALVADDQVFVSRVGSAVVAEAPDATAGLIELRGSGIVRLPLRPRAVINLAVVLSAPGDGPRLPERGAKIAVGQSGFVPSVRLGSPSADLAVIAALCPDLFADAVFSAADAHR